MTGAGPARAAPVPPAGVFAGKRKAGGQPWGQSPASRASAARSIAISSSAVSRRLRCSSTTSSGAFSTKAALASLRADAPASLPSLSSAFLSRSRSAAMSMTSARGRQKLAPWTAKVTAPFGASAALSNRSTRASCHHRAVALEGLGLRGREAESDEGDAGAGGHVHLVAHRAELLDQGDDPAHLGVGGGVDQLVAVGRPVGVAEELPRGAGLAPERLGDEGHERVHQHQALVEHPGDRRAGLGGAAAGSSRSGFASSTYQSQTLPQT